MNIVSRTITGILMIVVGLVLIIVSFFNLWFLLIYGIPLFIIGFFVLFNKKEDYIEPIKIKNQKGGRKK